MLTFYNILLWKIMLVIAWITIACHGGEGGSYVREACSVTIHQDLCRHSLAPFSNTARNHPDRWARAGLSVTISHVKAIAGSLSKMKQHRGFLKGRSRIAVLDCVECFEDALDSLHRSLGVLRKLNAKNFTSQMGDVTTWMSAALTDEDTCLDGFGRPKGKEVKWLVKKVTSVSYFTSNALALVNKLATNGPQCLEN